MTAGIIRERVLIEGGSYLRKYGLYISRIEIIVPFCSSWKCGKNLFYTTCSTKLKFELEKKSHKLLDDENNSSQKCYK